MKKVFIIHGYTGTPKSNWYTWLAEELQKIDIQANIPTMPNTNAPKLQEWLAHLKKSVGVVNENTYLVGHSLGCPTILRFLESLKNNEIIGGAVLVAGFTSPLPELSELDEFTQDNWDYENIKNRTNSIKLIHADNDAIVPLSYAEHIREVLQAELRIIKGVGHITESSGYTKAPFVLDEIKKMLKS
jgi:predicted alpha/beta hydrolase family esterase